MHPTPNIRITVETETQLTFSFANFLEIHLKLVLHMDVNLTNVTLFPVLLPEDKIHVYPGR